MCIHSCQRLRAGVSHQCGNGAVRKAVLKCLGPKGVAEVGDAEFCLELPFECAEAAIDSISRPWLTASVTEELSGGVSAKPAACDFKGGFAEIDDALPLAPLRLLRWKDPALFKSVDVSMFKPNDLFCTGTCLANDLQDVAKSLVLRRFKQCLEFFIRDNSVALASGRLIEVLDRRLFDVIQSDSPVQSGLNRPASVVFVARRPRCVRVKPSLHVMVLQFFDLQTFGNEVEELLAETEIPLIGAFGTVQLAPVKERVEYLGNGCADDFKLGGPTFQLMVTCECGVLIRAKIDLPAVESDVPGVASLPKPRFAKLGRHVENLSALAKRTPRRAERFAGSQAVGAAWGLYIDLLLTLIGDNFGDRPKSIDVSHYPRVDSNH